MLYVIKAQLSFFLEFEIKKGFQHIIFRRTITSKGSSTNIYSLATSTTVIHIVPELLQLLLPQALACIKP
ncbi:hypothetical protein ACJIZ3_018401 [Penstemon smallii]|uniref:Uncharacterized protein n=1 Tax=Penstemon smallii TaxID=265156 RepID=A0ABD3SY95_9LAMI